MGEGKTEAEKRKRGIRCGRGKKLGPIEPLAVRFAGRAWPELCSILPAAATTNNETVRSQPVEEARHTG